MKSVFELIKMIYYPPKYTLFHNIVIFHFPWNHKAKLKAKEEEEDPPMHCV